MIATWHPRQSAATALTLSVFTFAVWIPVSNDAAAQADATPQVETPPASTDAAPASDPEPLPAIQAEYRDVVARAIAEFDLGHAAEARALFLRAHALWPSARTRRTLGITAFELRMYPRALEELQGALEDPHRPLPPEQRAQVVELIEKSKAFVNRYQLLLEPANAELLVDGARQPTDRPLVLGVGVHQLSAHAAGYNDGYRELVVQGGEQDTLQFRLTRLRPEPQPQIATPAQPVARTRTDTEPNRAPASVAFAVAGLGVAVGTTA